MRLPEGTHQVFVPKKRKFREMTAEESAAWGDSQVQEPKKEKR